MLSQFSANPLKVIVSAAAVASFNRGWPCSELRARSYWFEFDRSGDLVDCDVPESDDGGAAAAMADDCKAWLFEDESPDWAPDQDSPAFIPGDDEQPAAMIPICDESTVARLEREQRDHAAQLDSDDIRVQMVRDSVLAALDATAADLYGPDVLGATDSELPALFVALDAQAAAMLSRGAEWSKHREAERNQAFRACPILCDFVATALQDLDGTESDEATSEEREARDSGTVYTLPESEFAKCRAICEAFAADHAADIEAALELEPGQDGLRYGRDYVTHGRIGSTLYLSSVGHGVSFTDDGDADCLANMEAAADAINFDSPYFGDDGRVYF